jgi:hypothetical protein
MISAAGSEVSAVPITANAKGTVDKLARGARSAPMMPPKVKKMIEPDTAKNCAVERIQRLRFEEGVIQRRYQ